jgi:hypothetical protein
MMVVFGTYTSLQAPVLQTCCSVLAFWIKGSGISSVSIYIKDSATKTLSTDVRFQQAQQLQNGVKILGNDEDGFIHVQIDLSTLRATAGNNASDASDLQAVEACTQGGVQQTFDKIVFADVSGMGFRVVLDDIKLVSRNTSQASSDDSQPLHTGMATLPPVFGEDLTELRAGVNRYSMSLKPEANFTLVSEICQELEGKTSGKRRFSGHCNTPVESVSKGCQPQCYDGHDWQLSWLGASSKPHLWEMPMQTCQMQRTCRLVT